jgi:cytochrome c oxidase subunit 2
MFLMNFFSNILNTINTFFFNFFEQFDFCKVSTILQGAFYDSASPVMEGIIDFHHEVFFGLIVILVIVSWFLFRIVYTYRFTGNVLHLHKQPQHQLLEIIWTITPTLVLIVFAIMSFTLLYATQEIIFGDMTIKVVGHQWYWSYEYYIPIKQKIKNI